MGITFVQLPLAIAVSGQEYLPIDCPNGDGTYTTKRVQLGAVNGVAQALKAQVIAAARVEFGTITGASLSQFIAEFVGDADNPDGSYDAYWLAPYAPLYGTLFNLLNLYLQALGLSPLVALTHLANIWAMAQTTPSPGYLAPPSTVLTVADLTALAAQLPTTLPSTVGALWNNGGVICVAQP